MGLNHKQVHTLHGNQFSAGALVIVIIIFLYLLLKRSPVVCMVCHIWRTKLKLNFKRQYRCAICHRLLPSIHRSSLVFYRLFLTCLDAAAKYFGTSSKKYPFLKRGYFFPDRQFLITVLLGQLCIEEAVAVEPCMQKTVLRIETGCLTHAHFLSAHRSHTQQTLSPQRDWLILALWHNTK